MSVLGAVIGDIIGAQYEFNRPKDLDWEHVPLIGNTGVRFTDDTVMTLAVKMALDKKLDLVTTMQKLGRLYPDCGFGGNFYYWIMDQAKPYNSWGNGSAMRVSYVADYFKNLSDVKEWAKKTAEVSHNHPEGIKGAVVTATCIWMAKNGKSKQDIYDYVLQEYPADKYKFSIDKDMAFLRKNYHWSVSCQDTVPVAMRCFYDSTDYESFIRNIFSLDCDSDTFGAVAGSVAEEFYHGFNFDAEAVVKKYLDKRLYGILKGE